MGRIRSWGDFEPDERDYFNDRYKNARKEADNFGDTYEVQRNLEDIKELNALRFPEMLTILIEKEMFE